MATLEYCLSTERHRQIEREKMYTLKIKWIQYENNSPNDSNTNSEERIVDESTLFIPADKVTVLRVIKSLDEMKAWEEGSYFNYQILSTESVGWVSRLIQVELGEKTTWYLASMAWLMSDTGKTIERLV